MCRDSGRDLTKRQAGQSPPKPWGNQECTVQPVTRDSEHTGSGAKKTQASLQKRSTGEPVRLRVPQENKANGRRTLSREEGKGIHGGGQEGGLSEQQPAQASEPSRMRRASQHEVRDPKTKDWGAGTRCPRPSRTRAFLGVLWVRGSKKGMIQHRASAPEQRTPCCGGAGHSGREGAHESKHSNEQTSGGQRVPGFWSQRRERHMWKGRNCSNPVGQDWKWIVRAHACVCARTELHAEIQV